MCFLSTCHQFLLKFTCFAAVCVLVAFNSRVVMLLATMLHGTIASLPSPAQEDSFPLLFIVGLKQPITSFSHRGWTNYISQDRKITRYYFHGPVQHEATSWPIKALSDWAGISKCEIQWDTESSGTYLKHVLPCNRHTKEEFEWRSISQQGQKTGATKVITACQ